MDRWWLFLLYSLMIWALYWVMSISVLQSLQGMAETSALEGGLAGASDELAEAMAGLSSLGLMDALYLIENNGLKCSYSGTGHVTSQSPKGGERTASGTTVNIVLR